MTSQAIVHRCTFIPWAPHSINSIAFDQVGRNYVAVARSDGDIELWNCVDAKWFLEGVITGSKDKPIRSVAWSQGRLFGASLSGDIFEFDVLQLRVAHSCNSHGGAIWDLKASPADPSLLAAACEDGHVRIFKISDEGISFLRGCGGTKNGERVLSVCWHGDGEVLFCGGADSQIRCLAVQSGRMLFAMTVENYGQEPTLIWSIQVLSDFTVISGDSLGHVQIWDGGIGTLRQSFAMHGADVLSVQVSEDEQHIYATGIDSKIVQFSCVDTTDSFGVGLPKKWVSTKSRRHHTHDVVSMTLAKNQNGDELIIAGGVDTQLSYILTKEFGDVKGRVHKFLPFRQAAVCCASASKLVACTQHHTANIWAMGRPKSTEASDIATLKDHTQLPLELGHRHLFKIQVATGGRNLQCSAIADSGRWFACAAVHVGLKLFRLRGSSSIHGGDDGGSDSGSDSDSDDDGATQLRLMRIRVPESVLSKDTHIHHLRFSHNSDQLLIVTSDNQLVLLNLPVNARNKREASEQLSVVASVDARLSLNDSGGVTLARTPSRIKYIDWSENGEWIAVAHSTNRVVVHPNPAVSQSTSGAAVTLPAQSSPITALAFQPSAAILGVAHASNQVSLFNVAQRQFTQWSRAWRRDRLPASVKRETHAITGLTFNPAQFERGSTSPAPPAKKKTRVGAKKAKAQEDPDSQPPAASFIGYGTEAVFFINSSVLPSQHQATLANAVASAALRKRKKTQKATPAARETGNDGLRAFKRSKKFKPTMFLQFIGPNELIAVQVPWARISKQFVLPLHRKRYGT